MEVRCSEPAASESHGLSQGKRFVSKGPCLYSTLGAMSITTYISCV